MKNVVTKLESFENEIAIYISETVPKKLYCFEATCTLYLMQIDIQAQASNYTVLKLHARCIRCK